MQRRELPKEICHHGWPFGTSTVEFGGLNNGWKRARKERERERERNWFKFQMSSVDKRKSQ